MVLRYRHIYVILVYGAIFYLNSEAQVTSLVPLAVIKIIRIIYITIFVYH